MRSPSEPPGIGFDSDNRAHFPLSFSLKGECQGPDGQPGYDHVCRLARALVEVRDLPGLTNTRVDRLVQLWHALPELDKRHLVYPHRHQERLVRGRFKATKAAAKTTSAVAGKESLQRYVFRTDVGRLRVSTTHTHSLTPS